MTWAIAASGIGTEDVKAPRLGQAVVGGQDGGVEEAFDRLALDGTIGELLDRAAARDGGRNIHGRKVSRETTV